MRERERNFQEKRERIQFFLREIKMISDSLRKIFFDTKCSQFDSK